MLYFDHQCSSPVLEHTLNHPTAYKLVARSPGQETNFSSFLKMKPESLFWPTPFEYISEHRQDLL